MQFGSNKPSYHERLSLGVKTMLPISADSDPKVKRRIRQSTGSRKLNVSAEVGTDISSCTSMGTSNVAVRFVMLVNMDA